MSKRTFRIDKKKLHEHKAILEAELQTAQEQLGFSPLKRTRLAKELAVRGLPEYPHKLNFIRYLMERYEEHWDFLYLVETFLKNWYARKNYILFFEKCLKEKGGLVHAELVDGKWTMENKQEIPKSFLKEILKPTEDEHGC